MTRAEAHIWIAVFASALPRGGTFEQSVIMADWAVEAMRARDPEKMEELNEALG